MNEIDKKKEGKQKWIQEKANFSRTTILLLVFEISIENCMNILATIFLDCENDTFEHSFRPCILD